MIAEREARNAGKAMQAATAEGSLTPQTTEGVETQKTASGEAAINRLARTNRTMLQTVKDWISDMVVKLTGTPEEKFFRNAERLYEKALREVGDVSNTNNGQAQYSLGETVDGKAVAVVDSDILSHIDTTNWDKAKREEAKKAAKTALLNFKDGIPFNGVQYTVNRDSRKEYTRSNETDKLFRTDKDAFADKMRAAANIDDVIKATSNWAQDGSLTHGRDDSFVDFERGKVLLQAGKNQYIGETVIGITKDGRRVFYDVVDINPTTFTTRRTPVPTSRGESPVNAMQGSPSVDNDTTSGQKVKSEYDAMRLPTAKEKFGAEPGEQSYGRSFDELAADIRPLPTAEELAAQREQAQRRLKKREIRIA